MFNDLVIGTYIRDNYDIGLKLIKEKYDHTMRVASLTDNLTNRLKLNDNEKELAHDIALFHDLGRFREVVRNNEFNNLKFDHGAYSNKILFNDRLINSFDIDEKDYLLIRKAIYYHNKKTLGNDLDNRERLFSMIIRDMDKIDILHVKAYNYQMKFWKKPSSIILKDFMMGKEIDIADVKNQSDIIILNIGFVDNLYFKESNEILSETGYLDEFIDSISVSQENKEVFNEIKEKVKVKKRC